MIYLPLAALLATSIVSPNKHDEQCPLGADQHDHIPPPPAPELIKVWRLPLPPVVESTDEGACTDSINPGRTGCNGKATYLQGDTSLPDDEHVLAMIRFAGASQSADPASIYAGQQVIIVKTDGSTFPNGDPWKCLTCSLPKANNHAMPVDAPDYGCPQAFADGKCVMAGFYIIDCGDLDLTSPECVPERTSIYQIRLDNTTDGSGPGASLRELRIHPDQIHKGFNSFSFSGSSLGQSTYFACLQFNAAPITGLPLAPRYDLVRANQLMHPGLSPSIYATENGLHFNHSAITVGELRGFSGTGNEVLYVGCPVESCNMDDFAADLRSGRVRRLTTHPGYVDPVHMSPDDSSIVVMDTRGFWPHEIYGWHARHSSDCRSYHHDDRYGDRSDYYGQEINGSSTGIPGSGDMDDPEWNGGADPLFSNDGTRIVYYQAQTVLPACDGKNPLPCYDSTELGGRTERLMIAHFVERSPLPRRKITPMPDKIPWAAPYVPGKDLPSMPALKPGNYTLKGQSSGSAAIQIIESNTKTTIKVHHSKFSDDGLATLHGTQEVSSEVERFSLNKVDWYGDLSQKGLWPSRQFTSEEGFHMSIDVLTNVFEADGTLTTVAEGLTFRQPMDGT